MTAPRPLPPCPICGREPVETVLGSPGYAANCAVECRVYQDHLLQVTGRTRQATRAAWRRLAGRPS